MTYFLIATTVIFSLICFAWSSKNWVNIFIKIAFFGMVGWAGFLLAQSLGYIVKV